jgi:hypothetical protein
MKWHSLLAFLMLLAVATHAPGQDPCAAGGDSSLPAASDECPLAAACTALPAGPRLWGGADYLMWWLRGGGAPPLVVTGSAADAFPGALDQPHTQILFGNRGLDDGMFNGVRAALGTWLDADRIWGVEASGFTLEQCSASFSAQGNANGQPFLAAPFVNANTGNDNVYFISQNLPTRSAFLTGAVSVASPTQLWSWEVNGVANVAASGNEVVSLLAGFRQLSLREDLSYQTAAQNLAAGGAASFLGTTLPPGFTVSTFDKFQTENLFNGGQLGARINPHWGAFALDLVAKVALGNMREEVTIQGQTTTNAPLPVTRAIGGIYAQASNIGEYSRDVFAVIPEAEANLCWDLTANVCARIGYTFLYVSSVARPGDQIDTRLNPNRVPIDGGFGTPGGLNQPIFDMHATGFCAQGLNFGLEFKF